MYYRMHPGKDARQGYNVSRQGSSQMIISSDRVRCAMPRVNPVEKIFLGITMDDSMTLEYLKMQVIYMLIGCHERSYCMIGRVHQDQYIST